MLSIRATATPEILWASSPLGSCSGLSPRPHHRYSGDTRYTAPRSSG